MEKIVWQKHSLDGPILLFITSVAISTLFSSPNKIQALLNPNYGLIMMVFLAILYFYLSRQKGPSLSASPFKVGPYIMKISSFLLSLITIIFYFQPFKNISPNFTPVGSQLDLAILLGFFVVYGIVSFPRRRESIRSWIPVFTGMTLVLNFVALFLTVFSLLRPTNYNLQPILMPPYRLSWYAAVEVLKNPQTAIIGIGPDNFSVIFNQVKDFAYNQSPLWQINSFNVSHSAILQILTETGMLGLISFGLLIFYVFHKKSSYELRTTPYTLCFIYLLIYLFIFPPSLIVWFLFFVVLGFINNHRTDVINHVSTHDLSDLIPVYIGIFLIFLASIGASGYFLGRAYLAEFYFKRSFKAIARQNLKQTYDDQKKAITLNPYIEKFHISFAQTNLLIVNTLSSKTKISSQDRNTIAQAIKIGIAESKAATSLNPKKSANWQSLAKFYLNVSSGIRGADAWVIAAYQRAILTDKQNPVYQVELGGVYYSEKKYDQALRFFKQAVFLKPDWANANYNLAWANFQLKDYPQAVNAMQNTLSLIDKNKNKTTYEKIQKELEDFKKMLSTTNESNKSN